MESKWLKEKSKLEKAILEDNISYEEIGRWYNCSGSYIRKIAKKIGIKLKARLSRDNIPKKVIKCLNCDKEFTKYYKAQKFCCHKCSS